MTFILPGGIGQLKPGAASEPVVPAVPSTWDPATKSYYAVLSAGNLTLQSSQNQFGSARGTNGRSMGKFYFELNQTAVNGTGQNGVGLCNSNFNISNVDQFDITSFVGMDPAGNSIGALASGSGTQIYLLFKGSYSIWMTSQASMPIRFMFAVDLDAGRLFWGARGFWRNAVGVNDLPDLTFTPGMWFPAAVLYMSPGGNGSVTLQSTAGNAVYYGTDPSIQPYGYRIWG